MALAPTPLTDLARYQINLDPKMVPMIIQGIISPALLAQMDDHLCDASEITSVTDLTYYQVALNLASLLKGDVKSVEEAVKPVVDALFAMHRASTSRRGELTSSATSECKRLEALATTWMQAEERRKREEAAAIQRQMEADARKAREESDRIALEAATDLAMAGKRAEADALLDQRARESAMEAQQPVMQVLAAPVLPAGVKPPAAQCVTWKARPITDAYSAKMTLLKATVLAPVLAELFFVDDAEIQRRARRQKGEFRVPGYESYSEASTVTRTAR